MACLGIATDMLVAFLPLRSIWKLQLRMRQKIALVVLLSLGLVYGRSIYPYLYNFERDPNVDSVCIISVVRLTALINLAKNRIDASYHAAPTHYWAAIELNLAIVCGSAPVLKPLVVIIIPRFASFGSSRGSTLPSFAKHKSSGSRMSSIELQDEGNLISMNKEVGGKGSHTITALPVVHKGNVPITRDVRLDYDHRFKAWSAASSQNHLVHQ